MSATIPPESRALRLLIEEPAKDRELPEEYPDPDPDERVRMSSGLDRLDRGDHVELARALVDDLMAIGPTVFCDGAMYLYRDVRGVFEVQRDSDLSCRVQGYAGLPVRQPDGEPPKPLKLKAHDVTGVLKLASDRVSHPEFFRDASHGIAFADVFVRVDANGIATAPHAPEHRARYAYPFPYDARPSAAWLGFLDGLFCDDPDRHEKIAAIQEHAGACLLGVATTYDRALVFEGEGNNGKSTLLEIIAPAMPHGSTSAIPPQDWDQEYRRAMLAGKLLNFVSELPESEIIASESFKAIVAGDQTVGRHIRQAPFNFHPVAGHIFAANRLPSTADQSSGFWRRFLVVTFRRNFTDDPERDPHVADRLVAKRPRVVSWMLAGAVRLFRQRDYTIPSSHVGALERWRRTSDQVAAWIEEHVSRAHPGFGTKATPAYRAFADWAKENGHRPPSSTKWAMRMTALGYPAVHTRDGNVYPIRIAGHDSAHLQREGV